ncbi:MAG: segregation/condensation protein A [Oscillospiraceae bacterium]|nr:segregation/condensation protein A [Oscillospiraceae bacterium]
MDIPSNAAPTFYLEKVVQSKQEVMEDFEGPLDVILFLLSKNKIEIQDLRISLLCRQFLEWLDARQSLEIEVASEFIAMAAHLVYIKSKNLLTVGEQANEEIDELKLQLEQRLLEEERGRLERLREFLAPRAELCRGIVTKPPCIPEKEKPYDRLHDPAELLCALGELFERSERRMPPPPEAFAGIVGKEPYPIGEKISYIFKKLRSRGKVLLRNLLAGAAGRSETVAAFLAVLEMCRNREIDLTEDSKGIWVQASDGR